MTYGSGRDLKERPVTTSEAGDTPRDCDDLVVAVVRGHRLLDYTHPQAATLQLTERLITRGCVERWDYLSFRCVLAVP